MTDATTTPNVDETMADFDVMEWLSEAKQPESTVEIYNDGPLVQKLQELTNFADQQKQKAQDDYANLATNMAITDEQAVASETLQAIEAVRQTLKGTGMTFSLMALSTGEKDVLAKKTARALKPVKAKGTFGEDDWQEAIPGGEDHPDYNENFSQELIARSIVSVTNSKGSVSTKKWTAAQVAKLQDGLLTLEYRRLSNAVYGINYLSYEIDKLVDVDFS